MKRLVHALLVGPLLLVAAAALSAQDKLAETPYYPLQVGTTWHYKSGDRKFTIRVVKHEKVGGVLCARLEVVRDGKVVASEHLAVTDEGVYRHSQTASGVGQFDSKSGEGAGKEEKPEPPILVLKLPPKKGDSWRVDSKADGKVFRGGFKIDEKEIKVPAGTYQAIRVTSEDLETNGLRSVLTTYFARGVGMVKQVIQVGDVTADIELEKFEAGK
jgi:hypothetical protein